MKLNFWLWIKENRFKYKFTNQMNLFMDLSMRCFKECQWGGFNGQPNKAWCLFQISNCAFTRWTRPIRIQRNSAWEGAGGISAWNASLSAIRLTYNKWKGLKPMDSLWYMAKMKIFIFALLMQEFYRVVVWTINALLTIRSKCFHFQKITKT